MALDSINLDRLSGSERIVDSKISRTLLDYWQWAYSDLVGNTERGNLAEYLVALSCGIDNEIRISWNSYDLELNNGIKIEVKSSAYLQSWKQKDFSKPIFSVSKTLAWDYLENTYDNKKKRQADVYVFALLAHKDKSTINPLDTKQWDFYILNTKILNKEVGDNKTISLGKIIKIGAIKSNFMDLKTNIHLSYGS